MFYNYAYVHPNKFISAQTKLMAENITFGHKLNMFVPKKVEHKNRVNFTNYCDIKPYPDA
jgi:hypothetical protein